MTTTEVLLRKSSQEIEIDHLLAEEFACDPTFVIRFLSACGLPSHGFRVTAVIAEPSLGGDGFGDLYVEGIVAEEHKTALLIEDKITAGPAVRQAERYAAFASRLRESGFATVWTILIAPASYSGQRKLYDRTISLETLATLIESRDPLRVAYRRGIIQRALTKKASTGVRVPDPTMHRLKAAYLQFASMWCSREGFELTFPSLRDAYSDGDNWFDGITHPVLPPGIRLRHRLWTSSKELCGLIDLIVVPITDADRNLIIDKAPEGARVSTFSKGEGLQVSVPLAELRQRTGFNDSVASSAFETMRRLIIWYQKTLLTSKP